MSKPKTSSVERLFLSQLSPEKRVLILALVVSMFLLFISHSVLYPLEVCSTHFLYLILAMFSLLFCSLLLNNSISRLHQVVIVAAIFLAIPLLRVCGSFLQLYYGLISWRDLLFPLICQVAVLVLILRVKSWCAKDHTVRQTVWVMITTLSVSALVPLVVVPVVLGEPFLTHRMTSLPLYIPRIEDMSSSGEILLSSGKKGNEYASVYSSDGQTLLWHVKLPASPIGARFIQDRPRFVLSANGPEHSSYLTLVEYTLTGSGSIKNIQCDRSLATSVITNCISPDGKTIALNGAVTTPFDNPQLPPNRTAEDKVWFVEWRPDCSQSVYYDEKKNELLLLPRDSGERTLFPLKHHPDNPDGIAMSPSGTQVAYSVGRSGFAVQDLKSGDERVALLPKALARANHSRLVWFGEGEIVYVTKKFSLCGVNPQKPGYPRYISPIYDFVVSTCNSRNAEKIFWTTAYFDSCGLHALPDKE